MNQTNNIDDQSLQWRVDVNAFRLLGRELITDRVTAIFELVKNCYDANAEEVTVTFNNVSTISEKSEIIISDNGTGMSFADIRDKWMVVGTNSKRVKLYSDAPYNRKFVGEKGVGRFAVDKLGARVKIKTKEKKDKNWLCVNINWDEYENLSNNAVEGQLSLFTEVKNKYSYEPAEVDKKGTKIIISKIFDKWSVNDIERLYKELSKLISPFYPVNPPFEIKIDSNEFISYQNKPVKPDAVKYYSHYAEIKYDSDKGMQETLAFDSKKGDLYKMHIDKQNFGPVKMRIYYFDEGAKRKYRNAYKNDDTRIDGIKIYRDGVITTPFAEYEDHVEKKRDILGIDKSRYSGAFDHVGIREVIGVLDITKKDNPQIIDATNRQDFIDTKEYKTLKEFILQQLDAFKEQKKYSRVAKRSVVENKLIDAGSDVKTFEKELSKIEKELSKTNPDAKKNIAKLKEQAKGLHRVISKGISEQKKYQKEVERKEKILYSIVSMQEFASLITHAVRTSIAKVKHLGEFFKLNYPNPKFDKFFKEYAVMIYNEMDTLLSVTDFMLSFANVDESSFEEFNVSTLISDLLKKQYSSVFRKEGIELELGLKDDFVIETNKKAFQDIFQNLVSNSVKALTNTKNKKIKCTGYLNTNNFVIYFSDNGYGLDMNDKDWIFGLYNTRTAEQGGAGVGLYVVEKQIKALNGDIEVVENEFKPTGATFKITIPFNNK
ncbi:sensor histidine kinase [uncultured Lacinutrix sp.]|uniref:sensor histidine kinase n=1 Tax=uncultured Lacinutrix sp. TaxID=574032 RepID=UPI002613F12B|nr:sensor histidine kinase [uncultured Lacinutrix sp.]